MLVRPTTCKSGAQTLDGSRYLDMPVNNLSISKTKRFLMYLETKMLKDNLSLLIQITEVQTKDGRSYILTKLRMQPKEFPRPQDLESTFHSSLSQDCQ
jgi:hypothetical protein